MIRQRAHVPSFNFGCSSSCAFESLALRAFVSGGAQDAIFSKTSTAMALRSGKILPTLEAGGSFEFSGDPQETTNRNIKEPQIFTMHTGDARQQVPSVDLCMRNW